MNYQGNEQMRKDAADISNELYELWQKVKRFEREYSFNSKNLTDLPGWPSYWNDGAKVGRVE
ncbi:hypothetical protein [Enterobacter hormaechei]|uniref:hypothetical protein n=1 Tax=Enterobacter hormaechei TaxID=158836 RepID=UPI00388F00A4